MKGIRLSAVPAVVAVVFSSAGCAFLPANRQSIASAEKLDDTHFNQSTILAFTDGRTRREFLGLVAAESERKCQTFINGIVLEEGNSNFYGDSISTLFSALATVAKPINTVHGLAAGSTIASGTKNAYLNGFFAKATIANFADAMQRSYASAMTQYLNGMPSLGDDMVVSDELAKIQSIHQLCSLASAEQVISATLKPQPGSDISVSADFDPRNTDAGKTSKLTLTLVNGSGAPATLSSDMTVAVTSSNANFSISSLKPAGTCTGSITIAADGKSFAYPKGAVVQSGGCTITFLFTLAAPGGTVGVSVKAGALATDKGTNSGDVTQSLTFASPAPAPTPAPTPAPAPAPAPAAAPTPASATPAPTPAPGPTPGPRAPARAPTPTPVAAAQTVMIAPSANANSATKACQPKNIHENPCGP